MFLPYERSLQPGLIGAGLIDPVAGLRAMCCCPTWTIIMARHSLIVEQGRADIACRRGSGVHSVPSDPGWTASPICSGLICGRHYWEDQGYNWFSGL
jgi:hypothetical protein